MTSTVFDLLKNPAYTQKGILEKIIVHTIQTSREDMITNMDRIITESEQETIKKQYHAYTEEKKPLEYIFGYCEFLERKFKVSPDTLIPRPETEYMILSVNRFLSNKKNILLCDIGTGCGVLGISTLCDNKDQIFKAYLTEISPSALSIARENRDFFSKHNQIHHEKICFLESNIIDFMREQNALSDLNIADTVCIIGNLPYIPLQTFDENVEDSVKLREPKFAFV
jgi:release factor glutamine methyltransferase